MSALGQKQTCAPHNGMSALPRIATAFPQTVMSALPSKADSCSAHVHVRYGPKADMATSASYWFAFLVCASAYQKRRALLSRRLLHRLRCRQRRFQLPRQQGLPLCFLPGSLARSLLRATDNALRTRHDWYGQSTENSNKNKCCLHLHPPIEK